MSGMAGVGKTQLAVHAAHLLTQEQAVDRVLFVDLRGFHPDRAHPPADPAAVLDGFLRLLGVPGQQIPHDLAARTAAYRRRLAGTRTAGEPPRLTAAEGASLAGAGARAGTPGELAEQGGRVR